MFVEDTPAFVMTSNCGPAVMPLPILLASHESNAFGVVRFTTRAVVAVGLWMGLGEEFVCTLLGLVCRAGGCRSLEQALHLVKGQKCMTVG